MMKTGLMKKNKLLSLLVLFSLSFSGLAANAPVYDHSASIECLKDPQKPHYNGGIVTNPEIKGSLQGWTRFGGAKIVQRRARGGNTFLVAYSRKKPFDSFSQTFNLIKDNHYALSAWIQVSSGSETVKAVFGTRSGFKHAGAVKAKAGCWSMLKGGLSVDSSIKAQLYFESENTTVEIWADNISLQPFTEEQWRAHQQRNIEKMRKRRVRIRATDAAGKPVAGARISVSQNGSAFPFGAAMNHNILTSPEYRSWFLSKGFTVTTFENEMKWYATEKSPGAVDYSTADAMLALAKANNIAVRGHTIFWDDPTYQQYWIRSLSADQLRSAAVGRLNSVMKKYSGDVVNWDVVNENLHFKFYEDRLGETASGMFYKMASDLDNATLFLNDYNTIEDARDTSVSPEKYAAKLKEMQGYLGTKGWRMGIGLESHFTVAPNLAYIRSTIDKLAYLNVPIWITEIDIQSNLDQAKYLEQVLREVFSHPAEIKGIVLWVAWDQGGCYRMCLTDNNFKNLATGDVVDKLMEEWRGGKFVGTADEEGLFDVSLFHGDYRVTVSQPPAVEAAAVNSFSLARDFKVEAPSSETAAMLVTVSP